MLKENCCNNDESGNNQITTTINFLKVINEPNRLKILCLLKENERCVCEICEALDQPQNLISHHLKTLKEFGLITVTQEGRKMIYKSNKTTINKYSKLLNDFLISNL